MTSSLSEARGSREKSVLGAFLVVQILVMTFMQKLGVAGLNLCLISFYAGVVVTVIWGRTGISAARVSSYTLFIVAATVSQLVCGREFSLNSFLFLLLTYLPFIFDWRMGWPEYLRTLNVLQKSMLVATVFVLIQLAWQGVFGMGNTLSLERFVPEPLLLKGFIYEAPFRFGELFVRPNGFFFLEPSFVSLYFACAILIEIAYFRRALWVATYLVGLAGCMGATGIGLLVLAAPFVLLRQPPRVVAAAVGGGVAALLALFLSGHGDVLVGRLSELSSPTSSGFARIVSPILQLVSLVQDGRNIWTGDGAGNIVDGLSSAWPIVKLSIEYGILTAIAFFVFVAVAVARADNRPLAIGLFLTFNFTGGYLLNPTIVLPMVLFASTLSPVGVALLPKWTLLGEKKQEELDDTEEELVPVKSR